MLAEFIKLLPEQNKDNLKTHAQEKIGIFNPNLYTNREKV
jgi:hypothetical protein